MLLLNKKNWLTRKHFLNIVIVPSVILHPLLHLLPQLPPHFPHCQHLQVLPRPTSYCISIMILLMLNPWWAMIVVVIVTRKLGDEQSESGHVNFIYCSVQKVNIEAALATHFTFHVSASSKHTYHKNTYKSPYLKGLAWSLSHISLANCPFDTTFDHCFVFAFVI